MNDSPKYEWLAQERRVDEGDIRGVNRVFCEENAGDGCRKRPLAGLGGASGLLSTPEDALTGSEGECPEASPSSPRPTRCRRPRGRGPARPASPNSARAPAHPPPACPWAARAAPWPPLAHAPGGPPGASPGSPRSSPWAGRGGGVEAGRTPRRTCSRSATGAPCGPCREAGEERQRDGYESRQGDGTGALEGGSGRDCAPRR